MEETGQEEMRPEYGASDNGLEEGGFVEVTREDAQMAAAQSWAQQTAVDDLDPFAPVERAAAEGLEEEERPLSPPPSPVEGQLIDFGGGSTQQTQATPPKAEGDEPRAPEPLFPTGEFNIDDMLGTAQAQTSDLLSDSAVPSSGEAGGDDDLLGGGEGGDGDLLGGGEGGDDFLAPTGGDTQEEERSSSLPDREPSPSPSPPPERDPSPPPRDPTPPPAPRDPTPPPAPRDPTPPPRDPTPPPPLPPRDPTPPPAPQDPTPPPPPSRSAVEDVVPAQSTQPVSRPTRGRVPKPGGYLQFLKALHPMVLYIIYWQDLKVSAVVLGVCLLVLLTLTINTLLHTWVLLLLSFMVVSLTYIVSKVLIDSFYNKKVQNPFHTYLEKDIVLPEDMLLEWVAYAVRKVEAKLNRLVRLLLFANIKHSLMFGVCLWVASFITNYITLLSAMFILVGVAFLVPWVYSQFQPVIDQQISTVTAKLGSISKKVVLYLPFGGKKKNE